MDKVRQILSLRQKRVTRLKRRTINIGEYRKNKELIIISANKSIRIREEQIKSIKQDLLTPLGVTLGKLTKFYTIKFLMVPNKTYTQKGILVRMGKGKGKLKTKLLYLTPGTSCIYFIPTLTNVSKELTKVLLNKFIQKYTFFTYKYAP